VFQTLGIRTVWPVLTREEQKRRGNTQEFCCMFEGRHKLKNGADVRWAKSQSAICLWFLSVWLLCYSRYARGYWIILDVVVARSRGQKASSEASVIIWNYWSCDTLNYDYMITEPPKILNYQLWYMIIESLMVVYCEAYQNKRTQMHELRAPNDYEKYTEQKYIYYWTSIDWTICSHRKYWTRICHISSQLNEPQTSSLCHQ
jgi:hypothetical protein